MAFVCAGRSVMLHRDRDAGDRTRRFIVGGGRRNNSGFRNADGRQGPVVCSETRGMGGAPRPCPPTPGRDVPNRAVAVESEMRLPLLPVKGSARWGAAKFGRAVGRFSQILAVLPFYSPVVKPVYLSLAETLGKKHLSTKPSEVTGDCAPCAWTLSDTYAFKGFLSRGNGWCWQSLFFQGVNENYHCRLWTRKFQRLIGSKTYALPQDSSRYSHHFYSSMKTLQQCRMYGNYKGDENYFGKNNGVLFPRGSKTVYYDILKVSPNATYSQIKTAYYKQSFLYHPDRNLGSEEAALRFIQISEAYSVLGSVSLRKKYDRGILTPADLHVGKKPSSKVHVSTVKQTQSGSSEGNLNEGKSKFNFDEFYRAHYGKQLEMEQLLRRRRMQLLENRDSLEKRLNLQRLVELSMMAMVIAGLVILCSLK